MRIPERNRFRRYLKFSQQYEICVPLSNDTAVVSRAFCVPWTLRRTLRLHYMLSPHVPDLAGQTRCVVLWAGYLPGMNRLEPPFVDKPLRFSFNPHNYDALRHCAVFERKIDILCIQCRWMRGDAKRCYCTLFLLLDGRLLYQRDIRIDLFGL